MWAVCTQNNFIIIMPSKFIVLQFKHVTSWSIFVVLRYYILLLVTVG